MTPATREIFRYPARERPFLPLLKNFSGSKKFGANILKATLLPTVVQSLVTIGRRTSPGLKINSCECDPSVYFVTSTPHFHTQFLHNGSRYSTRNSLSGEIADRSVGNFRGPFDPLKSGHACCAKRLNVAGCHLACRLILTLTTRSRKGVRRPPIRGQVAP